MKSWFYDKELSPRQRVEVDRIWRKRIPLIRYFLDEGMALTELCERWRLPESRLMDALRASDYGKRGRGRRSEFCLLTDEQRWLKGRLSAKGVCPDERNRIIENLFLPVNCPIFNIKLTYGGRKDHSATLDQIEPGGGYFLENIQVISFRANRIKNNAAPDELRILAEHMAVKKKGPPHKVFGVLISEADE